MKAIEIDGLTKTYQLNRVVDNINLSIEKGKVFGFLGPNGAGKTTTIRMLLGLVKPSSGTARILGFDVRTELSRVSHRIAAIVESPTFFPNMTALQTLRTFSEYCELGIGDKDLLEILDKCGILDAAKRKVDIFSLGMKQRLGIAVAMLNDPEVIFLDEPTNGLDPEGIVSVRKLIRTLAREEYKTIFLSSHLLNEVEQICDDVAILQSGKVKVTGRVAELLGNSRFSIKSYPLNKSESILRQYFPQLMIEQDTSLERLLVDADPQEIPNLVATLVRNSISVLEVSRIAQTLEEFFHQAIDSK